ncbi:VOC family protein [Actinocatenispora rupis]|uniref:Glyoxalase n=1 Tax=Actinocatenispora rupis TaxID=519421 RepID=A0A8J3NBM5_9ACTN|nr:VOC family protein [Actinocatenispora rupis]GID13221.1 glyoxalase [Actinocatenispora rupis]
MRVVVALDCRDPESLARFWAPTLGYQVAGPMAGAYLALVPHTGDGPQLLLQRVPEEKAGKNRMHLDLRVSDLAAEVARVVALGARRLTDEPLSEDGWTWHVLADPEGNEFCVLTPAG